ncbi:MAG: DUF1214 domain-containing protein [Pseudomonadota bacterium]|nr:DUF1214 domain-containing protein [Pseudomonadota bacterium]
MAFSAQRVAIEIPDDLPDGLSFYYELARALKYTPPKAKQDAVVAASLADIGFKDGNTRFDYRSLSDAERQGLAKAVQFGQHLMDVYAQTAGETVNGWRWSPQSGVMGTNYLFRAAFAKWFTGGNAPEEAIYMDGRHDNQGQPFDGGKRYRMHFASDQLPRVQAFWSLSMYHLSDGSFVPNPIDRYSIGDRTPDLRYDDDGSLDIYIQHEPPANARERANWLPTPDGRFYMDLRLYVPDDSLQKGAWAPPVVEFVE